MILNGWPSNDPMVLVLLFDNVNDNDTISLQMQDVNSINKVNNNYFLNTGSPHYVMFKNNVSEIDVYKRGQEIRNSAEFAVY